ncbi:MBOAT family O-acyltransferase [Pedobacter psychroterrae]|uniref:MBOAT family protein n=1 Tax=Pedobacter psychroterrae TaxID=2530453 RepID=A0A4R0NRJ5_9SPHI|nr:MBOAT family O-acyltransferase [Pedobacter psychroterrae]TCD01704.1 MBOAT family protein [Pedobacter psychroterrae]
MLFNSIDFAFYFIIVTVAYFLLPHRYRWILLLSASCYFYMAFVPIYILILGFTIVIDYFAGIYIEKAEGKKRKMLLICSLIANIGVLVVFKYYNFLNESLGYMLNNAGYQNPVPYLSILLPIGLSFHTFQAMSYTIEVYRGNQKAEQHFGIYSLYVMFYPQLVAGPIERPQNILSQMHAKHEFDYNRVVSGLQLMLWGFFKKLVVADRLSIYVNSIYGHPELHNGSSVAIASLFFAIQIYCDFSGYSDIAIGCARIMGYDLMINFRRPYFSKSISEFWSRWHISLSTWFRDYLYIPLGGNRVPKYRVYLNLMIVFLVSGIWHGANYTFILWGALHGFYLLCGLQFNKLRSGFTHRLHISSRVNNLLSIVLTIILVTFAWIFFRATSIKDAFTLVTNLKTIGQVPFLGDGISNMAHCVLAIALLFMVEYKMEYLSDRFNLLTHKIIWVRWSFLVISVFVILLFGVFSGGQFIYFQF